MIMQPGLTPGFAEPEADAQGLFRAVLDAMSHPGKRLAPRLDLAPPAPLLPLAGATALTLCDAETPIWLDPAFAPAMDWLRFHCGAPIVAEAERAAFAFLQGATLPDALDRFPAGTALSPEDGATLVIAVDGFAGGSRYILTGPGIEGEAALTVAGLAPRFLDHRQMQAGRFPMGHDAILVAPDGLACLPRTTQMRKG